MTPAEIITRRLKSAIEAAGATVPVRSALISALEGGRLDAPSSLIWLRVHVSNQRSEPLPHYDFAVAAGLSVAVDDDRDGSLFAANYAALWSALDSLAREDACSVLGDADDQDVENPVFSADGFRLTGGDPPEFQEDAAGGA